MCGRFTQRSPLDVIAAQFGPLVNKLRSLKPRYNIAPTQDVLVVRMAHGHRELVELRWGLIPFWAKDIKQSQTIVKGETIDKKPSFGPSFRQRRCLIPANGFYEWRKEVGAKQPYLFQVGDGELFCFAGIWNAWDYDGPRIESCAIITTVATDVVAQIHEKKRMPVILPPDKYGVSLCTFRRSLYNDLDETKSPVSKTRVGTGSRS